MARKPLPASRATAGASGSAETRPAEGGSYRRSADGSLERADAASSPADDDSRPETSARED